MAEQPHNANGWEGLDEELREKLRAAQDQREQLTVLNDYSWTVRHTQPHKALTAARYACQLAESLGDAAAQEHAYALRNLAAALLLLGSLDEALEHGEKAVEKFRTLGDLYGEVTTLLTLGWAQLRKGYPEHAYAAFARALQQCEQSLRQNPEDARMQQNRAAVVSAIGSVYKAIGDFKTALEHFLEAYQLQVQLGHLQGIAATALNIAGVYLQLRNHEEALRFAEQARELFERIGDTYNLAITLSDLGHIYGLQQRWQEGVECQQRALELYQQMGNQLGAAAVLSSMGVLMMHYADPVEALRKLFAALHIHQRLGNPYGQAIIHREIGDAYYKMGDPDRALEHYQLGMYLAEQLKLPGLEAEYARLCADIVEKPATKEAYRQALLLYKRYHTVREQFLGQQQQQAIAVLEKRLEVERIRWELELYRVRTAELAEALRQLEQKKAELEQAHEELKRLSAERTEIVHILSHELRNLTASILTNAEVIVRGIHRMSLERIRETAEDIVRVCGYMTDMLMNLSRSQDVDTREIHYYFQPEDLMQLIGEVVRHNQPMAERKDIELIVDSPENPAMLCIDWGKVREILENFVQNAIKYSPRGGKVWIRLRRTTDGGMRIAVEDQGCGIKPEEMPLLFKRFSRAPGSRPTAGEPSTGLGLYICKRLADGMRSRIWCESAYGQGSIFYLQLPYREGIGPCFIGDPIPEEWTRLRADYPTLEEAEGRVEPRPGWIAYYPPTPWDEEDTAGEQK